MSEPKISILLKSQFKEIARNIIKYDREARKSGKSQNTIGAIQGALMNAYRLGYQEAIEPISDANQQETFLNWAIIPPRSRRLLSHLTFCFCQRHGQPNFHNHQIDEIEPIILDGKRRWKRKQDKIDKFLISYSDGAIQPLIKLGVVELASGYSDSYKITALGIETCKEYWRRDDAGDLTLPKSNVRAF